VVGIGPGGSAHRTAAAVTAITQASCIAGYTPYVRSIEDLMQPEQRQVVSGMRAEVERVRAALEAAVEGERVALISSGDAGVYGMAGLALEMADELGLDLPIDIVPGVTAASAAAAALGAPLMLDYAVISLSDLLVSWQQIRRRLQAVAGADMCCVLYNPRSRKRVQQLAECVDIFQHQRGGEGLCGVVTNAGCIDQHSTICQLNELLAQDIGMRSCVVIGDSSARIMQGRMVTPRGYAVRSEETAC